MSLRVVEPGLYSLVVDFGRPNCRSLGVPVSGAADRTSLALGNALVGNAADAVGLEITLAGPILVAECDLACVVYGAPFALAVEGRTLQAGTTFTLHAGEELHVGGTPAGTRAYLCVHGGIDYPLVLGSRSALEPLRAGDVLPCGPSRIGARFVRLPHDPDANVLHVLEGAQAALFPRDRFFGQEYAVTPASNRMGLRLHGDPLPVPPGELLSEPVCPGTVQVTRDGQCVVLGVDGQAIGGYPKIAQVISADLDKLGQLRPGERLRFAPVTLNDAEDRYRAKQAALREWLTRLRVAEGFGAPQKHKEHKEKT